MTSQQPGFVGGLRKKEHKHTTGSIAVLCLKSSLVHVIFWSEKRHLKNVVLTSLKWRHCVEFFRVKMNCGNLIFTAAACYRMEPHTSALHRSSSRLTLNGCKTPTPPVVYFDKWIGAAHYILFSKYCIFMLFCRLCFIFLQKGRKMLHFSPGSRLNTSLAPCWLFPFTVFHC